MIVPRLLLAIAVSLACAPGRPGATVGPRPRTLALDLVKDRAICPIEVVVDYNPRRVPQRIKLLRCAREPLARCRAGDVFRWHCCDWREDRHVASCVEILDYVAVQFRSEGAAAALREEAYAVPVGCTCMAVPTTGALED